MPLIKEEDGRLYNVGFLCRRDGTYEMYEKIHVTPDEIKSWGLSGGKSLQTFDTDCAKIGVLICYDVEFPELSRIMADQACRYCSFLSLPTRRTPIRALRYVPMPAPSRTSVLWS